jgi:hypothetical protein
MVHALALLLVGSLVDDCLAWYTLPLFQFNKGRAAASITYSNGRRRQLELRERSASSAASQDTIPASSSSTIESEVLTGAYLDAAVVSWLADATAELEPLAGTPAAIDALRAAVLRSPPGAELPAELFQVMGVPGSFNIYLILYYSLSYVLLGGVYILSD